MFAQAGKIQHELLHTLGLWHEQSRDDRDEFVSVRWDNIEKKREHDFAVYTQAKTHHQGRFVKRCLQSAGADLYV